LWQSLGIWGGGKTIVAVSGVWGGGHLDIIMPVLKRIAALSTGIAT